MKQHPYCYPGTDVLKNKEDIRDVDQLEEFERMHSARRLETLPWKVPLSAAGYRRIHRYLLQDVYEWAGEYRFVNTGRGAPFCKAEFIAREMDRQFALLRTEQNLRGLDARKFSARAAEYFNELNAIHPFLDGNGRSNRAFLERLASQAGHEPDMARIDPAAWNSASALGFHKQDHSAMANIIAKTIAPDE